MCCSLFKHHRFPSDVILPAVGRYCRYRSIPDNQTRPCPRQAAWDCGRNPFRERTVWGRRVKNKMRRKPHLATADQRNTPRVIRFGAKAVRHARAVTPGRPGWRPAAICSAASSRPSTAADYDRCLHDARNAKIGRKAAGQVCPRSRAEGRKPLQGGCRSTGGRKCDASGADIAPHRPPEA